MTNSFQKTSGVSAWSITLCFMLAVVAIMLPDLAAASGSTADSNNLTQVVCNVILLLQDLY